MSLVATGADFSACVDDDGNLWSFGRNMYGQIGRTRFIQQSHTPKKIENLSDIVAVSCGFFHTVCLDRFGVIRTFGFGVYGNLGNGNTTQSCEPQIPHFGKDVKIKTFSCGTNFTICVDTNGNCYSFGINDVCQLGFDTQQEIVKTPQLISSLVDTPIQAVSCKGPFSLFLEESGNVKSIGCNTSGELGLGHREKVNSIQDIKSIQNIVAIAAGNSFSLFLGSRNEVYSCGDNSKGQLGRENTNTCVPEIITGLPAVVEIQCGYRCSMFIDEERNFWGCGDNNGGELGFGAVQSITTPTRISDVGKVSVISHSTVSTIIKRLDGTVVVFGLNAYGQLGVEVCSQINQPKELVHYSHIIGNPVRTRLKSARK